MVNFGTQYQYFESKAPIFFSNVFGESILYNHNIDHDHEKPEVTVMQVCGPFLLFGLELRSSDGTAPMYVPMFVGMYVHIGKSTNIVIRFAY
jgi:hypothetical protein